MIGQQPPPLEPSFASHDAAHGHVSRKKRRVQKSMQASLPKIVLSRDRSIPACREPLFPRPEGSAMLEDSSKCQDNGFQGPPPKRFRVPHAAFKAREVLE